MVENMQRVQRDAGLTRADLLILTENAYAAAWICDAKRQAYLAKLTAFATQSERSETRWQAGCPTSCL
jgi:hypothetical protein